MTPRRAAVWAGLGVAAALLLVLWNASWSQPVAGGLEWPVNGPREGGGGIIRSVPVQSKVVAITFDDGPDPRVTRPVLEVLRKFSVHCTFFLVGLEVERYPDVAKEYVADGHEIGCHTYSHRNLRGVAPEVVNTELDQAEKTFARVLGVHPTLFRFPHLVQSGPAVAAVQARGYTVIGCSLDSYDWKITDADQLAKRVTSLVKPGDIVLMHDGGGRGLAKTVKALTLIFQTLQDQGYRCVTVSELIETGMREAGRDQAGD